MLLASADVFDVHRKYTVIHTVVYGILSNVFANTRTIIAQQIIKQLNKTENVMQENVELIKKNAVAVFFQINDDLKIN